MMIFPLLDVKRFANHRLAPVLLFIIFCVGFTSANSEHPLFRYKKQDQEGSLISGRVLDGQTLQPVSQARVYLNNFPALSAMSDNDGYFQLETGPINYPSQLTLVCSGDEYYAREYPLNLVRDQEIISLGWIFLEKIDKEPAPEFSEVLLFGMLVDDKDGSAVKTAQTITIEGAPEINFDLDRSGVFHTRVSKDFFSQRAGKFLMNTSAEGYATTITDARLSPGLSYYDFGKIKLTYVGEQAPPEEATDPAEESDPQDPGKVSAEEIAEAIAEEVVEEIEEIPEIPAPNVPEEVEVPVTTDPGAVEPAKPELPEATETPEIMEVPVVTEPPGIELPSGTPEPSEPAIAAEEDERELKELQQAYFLLKTLESQGDHLDREGVDLLALIFERYESPKSAAHLATLAEEESLTIPCIEEGMQVYRSEYFARLSRMLKQYLDNYNLNEIRVEENQKFYRELLGTLAYLDNFYENNPEEPDKAAYENTVDLFSNIITRYFKED